MPMCRPQGRGVSVKGWGERRVTDLRECEGSSWEKDWDRCCWGFLSHLGLVMGGGRGTAGNRRCWWWIWIWALGQLAMRAQVVWGNN